MPHEFKFSPGDMLECKLTNAVLHVVRRVIDADDQRPLYWVTNGGKSWLWGADDLEADYQRVVP